MTANPLGAKRDGGWRGDLDNDTFVAAFGGNNEAGAVDVATAVNGHGGPRLDFKSETFLLHGYSSNAMAGDGDAAAAIPSDLARCLDTTGGFAPNQGGTVVAEPFTLAIRGRGDDSDLEVRQDGTANALLTPNGGRGGINVGAVAYGLRSDAGRPGEALTPSPDAEGKIRLRDPGFNVYEEHAPTLDGGAAHAVAFGWAKSAAQTLTTDAETTDALQACPTSNPAIQSAMTVRRLTPRECERLQGFPDDYTLIDFKGKPAADGSRYRAIGNSFPVTVVRWIGRRIEMVDLVDRVAGPLFAAAEEGTR